MDYSKQIEEGIMDFGLFLEIDHEVNKGATKTELLEWINEETIEQYKKYGEERDYFWIHGGVKNLVIE